MRTFDAIQMRLQECSLLPPLSAGSMKLIDTIRSVRGEFVRILRDSVVERHPNPALEMNNEGHYLGGCLEVSHASLARSPLEHASYRFIPPTASLSYINTSRSVDLSQGGDCSNSENLDALAGGHLALASLLYPALL